MTATMEEHVIERIKRLARELDDGGRSGSVNVRPDDKNDRAAVHCALLDNRTEFGRSLVDSIGTRGDLSPKQWYWAIKITGEQFAPEADQDDGGMWDFADIAARFQSARDNGLQFPKVKLQTDTGQPVKMTLGGSRSKHPGGVRVTDGKPYGENQFFGWIMPNGEYRPTRRTPESVPSLLQAYNDDPADVAGSYGKMMGSCCFCNQTLSDDRSLDVGYGPVCAGNHGLPWGSRS